MAEVVRINFAPIFSDFEIFSGIRAPIVAPPIDDFQTRSVRLKVLSSPKKSCKRHLNRTTNADAIVVEKNATIF